WRRHDAEVGCAHTVAVEDRPFDDALGIDRAVEMDMQVGALRHAAQEVAQGGMIVAQRVEAGGRHHHREVARNDDDPHEQYSDRSRECGNNNRPASQGLLPRKKSAQLSVSATATPHTAAIPKFANEIAAQNDANSGSRTLEHFAQAWEPAFALVRGVSVCPGNGHMSLRCERFSA